MKKIILFTMIALCANGLFAQHHPGCGHPGVNHNQTLSVVLTAMHNEEFVVYVDGDLMNRQPMRQVEILNLTPTMHDIYVVMKRPYDKITMMTFSPQFPKEEFLVSYNTNNRMLEILSTAPQIPQNQIAISCPDEDVNQLVKNLKDLVFDNDRLAIAKGFTSHTLLTSRQICKIVKEFSFDDAKVDYLKYAYAYCSDKQNYYQCTEQLTFSSNKKELLNFINNN